MTRVWLLGQLIGELTYSLLLCRTEMEVLKMSLLVTIIGMSITTTAVTLAQLSGGLEIVLPKGSLPLMVLNTMLRATTVGPIMM